MPITDTNCCNFIINFPGIDPTLGIISISSRSNTEYSKVGSVVIKGAITGVVSVTAYASSTLHVGCSGRAGVTIPWISKYDCDNDEVVYLYAGGGSAYKSGNTESYITLGAYPTNIYKVLNASAASGPYGMYEDSDQTDGFGLKYEGSPWAFNTEVESSITMGGILPGYDSLILQGFSLQCTPGELSIASYEFAYKIPAQE